MVHVVSIKDWLIDHKGKINFHLDRLHCLNTLHSPSDQSTNQPAEQIISNDQCSNRSNVTKGYNVNESNPQNLELKVH